MKKLICLLFLVPTTSFALGSFQLLDFTSLPSAVSMTPYETTINFIYSGDNIPSVSLTGNQLPQGLSLGKIYFGKNGVDYVKIEGTPVYPGAYKLTLLLTDNYGAILTKQIDLVVDDGGYDLSADLPSDLPIGIINKPYKGKVQILYSGTKPELYCLCNPPGIFTTQDDVPNLTNPAVKRGALLLTFFGTPTQTGTFPLTFTISSPTGKVTKYLSIKVAESPSVPQQNFSNPTSTESTKNLEPEQKLTNKVKSTERPVLKSFVSELKPKPVNFAMEVSTTTRLNNDNKKSFTQKIKINLKNFLQNIIDKI